MASKLITILQVACIATISGSTRYPKVGFDVTECPEDSIWRRVLEKRAHESKLEPCNAAHIYAIRRTIDLLSADSRELLKRSPADFTRDSFQQFLREMDLEIGEIPAWSPSNKFDSASRWRRFLISCEGILGDGSPIANALDGYHTPLKHLSLGRPIPKSRFERTFSGDLISTIAHESPDELLIKARQQVRERLETIANACLNEIALYEEICAYQQKCLGILVPAKARIHILGIITGQRSAGTHGNDRWYGYDDQWIAAVALSHIDSERLFKIQKNGTYEGLYLPSPRTVRSLKQFDHYQFATSAQPWFFARHRLPNRVMTVMFLFLLERTGWNPGALGRMTVDGVINKGGNLTLQGFKQKTDDDTPIYEVPRSEFSVRKIIVMLERNREQLIAHHIIPISNKFLWFGWQTGGYENVMNHVHQLAVRHFCEKYQLPHFSPSELRPINAAATYLQEQDLRAVQILLGHRSLTTVESYLNDTLFFHINEAKALQFQRTIESTLIFETRGPSKMAAMKIEDRFVDTNLLFPTGDGGYCVAPESPPHQIKKGELCDGLRCHLDGGCRNYKLHVDARALEMAVRTKEFYQSSWQTILHRNETAFKRIHIPRIIFIHMLLKVVAEKRPSLLKSVMTQSAHSGDS